jgi:hypothetical protein
MIEFLERGLVKASSQVEKRSIYKLDIRPCKACGYCMRQTSIQCAQEDDMKYLYPLVAQSDLLMLVSPIYLDGMTGPMKVFIDRLIALLKWEIEVHDSRVRHPAKDGVKDGLIGLMSASAFPETETFDPIIAHVKAISRNLNRRYAGEIIVPASGYLRRGGDWETILRMIESAGVHLAKNGRVPESVSSDIIPLISNEVFVRKLNAFIATLT